VTWCGSDPERNQQPWRGTCEYCGSECCCRSWNFETRENGVIAGWANYTGSLRLGPLSGERDRRCIDAAMVRSNAKGRPGVRLRVAIRRLSDMATMCRIVTGNQAHQTMCRTRQERGDNGNSQEATHGNAEPV